MRKVLGDHVTQAGSYVGPDRLRFDFTHFEALTPEQISAIEQLANEEIMKAVSMHIYETSLDEARASGVMALFGEKYGEKVRVVEAGEFSRELCGGCHVGNTAEIGFLKILGESSIGSNTRRIEAVTSYGALEYVNSIERELKAAASELKAPLFEVSQRAAANLKALKELQHEAKHNKGLVSDDGISTLLESAVASKDGYPVVISRCEVHDGGQMRNLWDVIRSRMTEPGAVVLAAVKDDRPILMAAGSDEAVAAGFNAGAVIKAIAPCVKGGGGGKPTMAQAGGKDASGIDAALAAAKEMLLS